MFVCGCTFFAPEAVPVRTRCDFCLIVVENIVCYCVVGIIMGSGGGILPLHFCSRKYRVRLNGQLDDGQTATVPASSPSKNTQTKHSTISLNINGHSTTAAQPAGGHSPGSYSLLCCLGRQSTPECNTKSIIAATRTVDGKCPSGPTQG